MTTPPLVARLQNFLARCTQRQADCQHGWSKRVERCIHCVCDEGRAADIEIDSLQNALTEAQREIQIRDLATPIEEDLSSRIDEMLKYLAMEDGFTLIGIARLLVEVQKRMAADWLEIGELRRKAKQAEHAEATQARLLADIEQAIESIPSEGIYDPVDMLCAVRAVLAKFKVQV